MSDCHMINGDEGCVYLFIFYLLSIGILPTVLDLIHANVVKMPFNFQCSNFSNVTRLEILVVPIMDECVTG